MLGSIAKKDRGYGSRKKFLDLNSQLDDLEKRGTKASFHKKHGG
jgi:hypothetical protein